jgi:hypothetical protein
MLSAIVIVSIVFVAIFALSVVEEFVAGT